MADDDILERNVERLLTQAHDPPKLAPEARARVLAGLKQRHVPVAAAAEPTPLRRVWVAAAALAVAAVLALAWAIAAFDGAAPTADDVTRGEVVRNDSAAPMPVDLEDGSQVILRGGSSIEKVARREIRLTRGELLVDVAKDSTPFVVHTAHGRAIAVGTRFSVRHEDEGSLAAVARGKVRLESGGGEATLAAGESGRLRPDAAPEKTLGARLSHTLAWAKHAMEHLDGEIRKPARRGNLVARDQWSGKDWPLPMREMVVDIHVEDGIARTTIDQTFFNHLPRQLEGVYSFPLPGDAAISRLAMYVDGKLMEGGIVERDRGRNVYESIVYQRRDPALLEWMKGNEFRVRIFPLPGRREKRIIMSYTQPLQSSYGAYHLEVPIPEIDLPVGIFDVRVRVEGRELEVSSDSHPLKTAGSGESFFHGERVEIGDDLVLTLRPNRPEPPRTIAYADEGGTYVMARAEPRIQGASEHVARSWVVLYDTSASRSPEDLEGQTLLAQRFLQHMDEDDRVAVAAFDTGVRAMPGGFVRVADLPRAQLDGFLVDQGRDAAGVTDLGLALDEAVRMLGTEPLAPHILYLGDGMVTAGEAELDPLRERVRGKATVVAVAVGDGTDERTLEALADASGGLTARVSAGEDPGWRAFEILSTLAAPRVVDLTAELLDAEGKAVEDLEPLLSTRRLAHGEGMSVLARTSASAELEVSTLRLRGTRAGEPWSQDIALTAQSLEARYLPRLWAKARVDAWLDEGEDAKPAEITELGMEHFLITPHTSLLVLENDAMYKEFKVTRPSAEDWAHYESPAEVRVVYEPADADPLGLGAPGEELVLRDPAPVLSMPGALTAGITSTISVGNLGLRGTGRGGGGFGLSASPDIDAPAAATGASIRWADADQWRGGDLRDTTLRGTRQDAKTSDFTRVIEQPIDAQAVGKTVKAKSTSSSWGGGKAARRSRGPAVGRFAAHISTRGGYYGYRYGGVNLPWPSAMHYSGDLRLNDLTMFVPGMFADGYDYAREELAIASLDAEGGSMTAEARTLVEAAREALDAATYDLPDGATLSLAADGTFTLTRTTAEGLDERLIYDGENAYSLYEELGLAVRRKIGTTAPLLFAAQLPWVMPRPEHLERWFDVTVSAPRRLRLVPAGEEEAAFELQLDESHRIVELVRGGIATRITHDPTAVTTEVLGRKASLPTRAPSSVTTEVRESDWTVVELPLRPQKHWDAEAGKETPGSSAWRIALRQRMATAVAEGAYPTLAGLARELTAEELAPEPGELALLSGATSYLSTKEVEGLLPKGSRGPVAEYLHISRDSLDHMRSGAGYGSVPATSPWTKALRKSPEGLVGTLVGYRASLGAVERGKTTGVADFVDQAGSSELAYVLVQRAAQNGYGRPEEAAESWMLLADIERWRVLAPYAAGQALAAWGRYAEGADYYEQSLKAALDADAAPLFDWQVRQAIVSGRGQASFDLLWSRWRGAATTGSLSLRAAFVSAATQLGKTEDAHRVVATIREEHLSDVSAAVALLDGLVAASRHDDAWLLARRLLATDAGDDPAVLDRASTISEQQGRIADAAGYFERVMEAEEGVPMTLDALRADYTRLLGLHARLAQSPLDPAQAQTHRDHALDVARQWRREDPDNAQIDILCARLYLEDPDAAWRQLSSIVERHPAEGSAYAAVAGALEGEGELQRADAVWKRAVAVEPTNPTWLMRRAENLAATGDTKAARSHLEQIADGEWQPRFANVVSQAKQLAKHL